MQFSNHHFQGPFPKHNLSTRRKQTYLLKIDGWKTMFPFKRAYAFSFLFYFVGGWGKSFEISRWFKVIKLHPLIGGHLPFEGSLSHLKRGHRELPVARMILFITYLIFLFDARMKRTHFPGFLRVHKNLGSFLHAIISNTWEVPRPIPWSLSPVTFEWKYWVFFYRFFHGFQNFNNPGIVCCESST